MEILIPQWVINASILMLGIASLLCLFRVARGPTLADRALALDAVTICVIGAISAYSLAVDTLDDLSVVLLIAILGFVGLFVAAKYIGGGGDVIDRN